MRKSKVLFFSFIVLSVLVTVGCFTKENSKDKMLQKLETTLTVFPRSVEEVNKRVELAIAKAQKSLDEILNLKEARTFENTVRAYDNVDGVFSQDSSAINIIQMVHQDKAMRDACLEAELKLQAYALDGFIKPEFYQAFKEVAESGEKLGAQEQYFLKQALKGFKKSGLDKSLEEQVEIKKLQKELAKLSSEFEANIAKDKKTIAVAAGELVGLNPEFIAQLEKDGVGNYILNTTYPVYFEVMKHCSVSETRKKLNNIFDNRAYPVNQELLEKIISLRDKKAKLLGYASYSEINIDDSMAGTPERAGNFILDLLKKAQQKALCEFNDLKKNLPQGVALTRDGKLNSWDLSYAKEQYKQKAYAVDEREIQEYFPLDKTIDGIFSIYQKFLGLRFEQVVSSSLWSDDLKILAIYDAATNQLLGYDILDLHPRDNKFTHACHAGIVRPLRNDDGTRTISLGVMVANFPKGTANKPALLKHNDVVTFFHEFGHGMHELLGATKMAGHTGTSVKRDFVEMPSQMFEEWMWDKEILALVTSHYKTGKPLPSELIDKMIMLKNFDSGYHVARQCWLSQISLGYFDESIDKDLSAIEKDLACQAIPFIHYSPDSHFYVSFGHLMGYGAKYYGYMWSKVFALDLFDAVKRGGLLSPVIGKTFADKLLVPGGSKDPNELLFDFLGREPNQKAFLKDLGL